MSGEHQADCRPGQWRPALPGPLCIQCHHYPFIHCHCHPVLGLALHVFNVIIVHCHCHSVLSSIDSPCIVLIIHCHCHPILALHPPCIVISSSKISLSSPPRSRMRKILMRTTTKRSLFASSQISHNWQFLR